MKEIQIIITIKKDGQIVSETKGMKGPTCVGELEKLFKDFDGPKVLERTSEYYDQTVTANNQATITKGVK